MRRVKINIRRVSFGTLFLVCFSCAFSAVSLTLLLLLPLAEIDPKFTPATFVGGAFAMLTIWPLGVALWFSACGWIGLAVVGRFRRLPFIVLCDDEAGLQTSTIEAANQMPDSIASSNTPLAGNEPRR